MEHYKQVTQKLYDRYADVFEQRSKTRLDQYLLEPAQKFLQYISESYPRGLILDLGSGHGRDSLYFKNKGFFSVCLDLSSTMAEKCGEKGLQAVIADIERLPFPPNTFNGVWAHTSLLHLQKEVLPVVIRQIALLLKAKGIFMIGMKQGEGEHYYEENPNYPGERRFIALYSEEEIEKLLPPEFNILHFSKLSVDEHNHYFNFICMKTSQA